MAQRRGLLAPVACALAGCVLLAAGRASASAAAVAILGDPTSVDQDETAARLATALVETGLRPTALSLEDMAAPSCFNAARYDWLIHPRSRFFPVSAAGNVRQFLQEGGDLVLLGGDAFKTPLWRVGDTWLDKDAMEARRAAGAEDAVEMLSFDAEDVSAWQRATSNEQAPSGVAVVASGDGRCLRLSLKDLTHGWDNFVRPLPHSIPPGHNALCFSARGDARTPELLAELTEDDGARWVAVVGLRRQWTAVTLTTDQFRFWEDHSPAGRGGSDDAVRMEHVTRLSLGLAYGLSDQPPGDHTVEIGDVATARVDAMADVDLSARFELAGAFSDYEVYELHDVARVVPHSGQDLLAGDLPFEGPFEGLSAIGLEMPNESAFVPLLAALDAQGRTQGWALGLLVHYDGPFKGSQWLLSGITSPHFYADPRFAATLAQVMQRLASRDMVEEAHEADRASRARRPALETPAPEGYCRLCPDTNRILLPDGTPLFMLGCNYIGPFDRKCYMGGARFDARLLEDDFRKAKDAGLNCMRFWLFGMENDPAKVAAVRELARRYGVYLLLHLGPKATTAEAILEAVRKAARAFADEPMVIGYDLMNEPYVGTVGAVTFAGQRSPLIRGRPHDAMATDADRAWVAARMARRSGWPPVDTGLGENDARQLYAAYALWNRYTGEFGLGGLNYSTFPGLEGGLPRSPQWKPFLTLVDDTFAAWIRMQVAAIREVDAHHLITVGYNSVLSCLPANETLDFVSQHVYQVPSNRKNVLKNCGAMDRLAATWPNQPVTLGEFGYSNGLRLGRDYLDVHTSAVGEMVSYLYALAHGHSGCMKWSLTDWSLPVLQRDAPWIQKDKQVYESRFGLYWNDGTMGGSPKPIAHALRFLRAYVDRAGTGGTLEVTDADNAVGTAYRYEGERAIFIGDSRHESKPLSFEAQHPTNLMVVWDDAHIKMMSSSDARARLRPAAFAAGLRAKSARIAGRHGGVKRRCKSLEIQLLSGENVLVSRP